MSWDGMNGRDEKLTLDRLESLLDAYGGDLTRWPGRLAPRAEILIRNSTEARRLHAEAQALDRLLGKASMPDPAKLDKLATRILAAAEQEGLARRDEAGEQHVARARVIPLPRGDRAGGNRVGDAGTGRVMPLPARGAVRGRWFGGGSWPAAAALAASLAFGFAIGLSDMAPRATYNVASLVQSSPSDVEVALTELQLDSLNGLDEDQI